MRVEFTSKEGTKHVFESEIEMREGMEIVIAGAAAIVGKVRYRVESGTLVQLIAEAASYKPSYHNL